MSKFFLKSTSGALMLMFLAACGGGGGGSDGGSQTSGNSSSGSTTPVTTAAIALVPPAASSVPAYTPTGNVATDSLRWLNNVRGAMGLPLFTSNAAVTQAAQNHANYLAANDQSGHYENTGQTDFTGLDPFTRVTALYSTDTVGEVTVTWNGNYTGAQPSLGGVQSIFDAPFHRTVVLGDFSVVGSAYATGVVLTNIPYNALVMDVATAANTLAANQFVVYPYSGQQGAQYQWIAAESPNPFNNNTTYEGQNVGYPVTIQGQVSDALKISSFTITSNGANVPCEEVDPSTANIGSELHGAALCVPYQPLTPSTQYTANVVGTKNGQAFNVSWSWTTVAAAAVSNKAVMPATGSTPKPQIN
ncbi:CAP domain-containing protein [Paraburkholderia tropica]|uniref:CAP domain-containing protein n=1 Tax=Paraburkholderia tropica TaxID=92647 RepID=UPI003D2A0FB4